MLTPIPWQITKFAQETGDVFTVWLSPQDEAVSETYRFEPGQFNMLYLFGVGEVPISISGDSTQRGHVVHTTRAVGTVTKAMSSLKKGELIGVRGPFGSAWPIEQAKGQDIVLITGGIGLAPLRPVIYAIKNQRNSFGKVALMIGARSPQDILFQEEFEIWRKAGIQVLVTVDGADSSWLGHVGVVTTLIEDGDFRPSQTTAMICGPEVMMRFSVRDLASRGVNLNNIYISMERNMKCAVGVCGHCQLGPKFICKDGPVFPYPVMAPTFDIREL